MYFILLFWFLCIKKQFLNSFGFCLSFVVTVIVSQCICLSVSWVYCYLLLRARARARARVCVCVCVVCLSLTFIGAFGGKGGDVFYNLILVSVYYKN